eukprot:8850757-Alexandrium_andersonii.AAC.1
MQHLPTSIDLAFTQRSPHSNLIVCRLSRCVKGKALNDPKEGPRTGRYSMTRKASIDRTELPIEPTEP